MSETSLSLLERLQQQPDSLSWQQLVEVYAPLIGRWLARTPLQATDRDDLMQEVLEVVVRKVPEFQRRREGSFRAWLRVVTVNCLREFWRSQKYRPTATGDSDFLKKLQELEDPHSGLTRIWNDEHDRHVVRRLLDLIEPQFEAVTRQAFRQVVLEGQKPAQVAAHLGISVNAVLLAKSRVLRQLRREMDGLV